MFTGIIEETGIVRDFTFLNKGAKLKVECIKILDDINIGDSIAVNGCCQTVTETGSGYFCAELSEETLNITNFRNIKHSDQVNLERALTPNSRIGGHIVQGHIDCTGKFLRYEKQADFYNLTFEIPKLQTKYVVKKGSIAVNGISLTVADIKDNIFKTAIIPHTFNNTNLHNCKPGDTVNIETDILGRYIEKFLSPVNNNNTLNEDFLKENGFI